MSTANLHDMTDLERSDYYGRIQTMLTDGWSRKRISEYLGISEQAARRHISHVKGMMTNTERALAIPDSYDSVIPALVGRAVDVVIDPRDKQGLRGGRQTQANLPVRVGTQVPQPEAGDWRLDNIQPAALRRMTPAELLPKLIRYSPEMSRAHYDYLRMANPGWELKAYKPTGKDTPSKEGQDYLDWCVRELARRNGSAEVVWNAILSNLGVRGALFAEMVLEKDARTFANIVVPDAYLARFKVVEDTLYGGEKYQLVQGSGRNEIILDRPTVKYIPLDPLPDSPYGTSMFSPGIFPAIFLITMLQDARRVVAQQGWPRLDIMVDVAKIIAAMPPNDQQNAKKIKEVVDKAVAEVSRSYADLDPDQAWVHSDTVTFGEAIGAIGQLDGIDALVAVLERMAIRALKSMPLLFGLEEGTSEANANRQWEVHVQGIQAVQQLAAEALSSMFTLALEANGIAALARFTFKELRAAEELRDAQVFFQKLENAQRAEVLDYYTHDEASIYAVGHPAIHDIIGQVGDPDDEHAELPGTDPEAGNEMEGDTGDEKPPKTDDGATLSMGRPLARATDPELIKAVFANPLTAEGVALAMAVLSGRVATPKLKPKGKIENTGNETISIKQGDIAAAKRDFDGRVDEEYIGMLDAEPLDKTGESDG